MSLTTEAEEKFSFILSSISENIKVLSDWEKGFYDDMVKRYDEFQANIRISEKQWSVLQRMYEKATGG